MTLEVTRGGTVVAPPADLLDLPTVDRDRYQSLAEHARGGLGRVVRAQDRHLRRPVAIKEMLTPDREGSGSARFVREALVTARLQHPGIVPVYDAGYWPSGEPFYAMKLVSGRTLADAIAAAEGIDGRLALLPQVLAAAQAVAYAHSQGIIHRDLKPSNVMLGPYGETVVVDWGLAKDLHAAEAIADVSRPADVYELSHFDMTRVGSVVGTPGYMPPEQAAGEAVDERADVYALGALLRAVLVGKAPGATKDAPPVDLLALGAPRDVVAIVAKAMAPAPADRYANAGQMAEDLSRFLAGQLVSARRYGALTRAARFFSRRRVPLAFAAALVVVLAVTAVESVRRILRERGAARARSAQLVLAQARAYIERDPTATLAWLKQYPEDGAEVADAASLAADAVSRGVARHVLYAPNGERLDAAALSIDGRLIVTAARKSLWFRDAMSGRIEREVPISQVFSLDFLPDGKGVVAITEDHGVWLVDSSTGAKRRLGAHKGILVTAVSPDGNLVATGSEDGSVLGWPLPEGPSVTLARHSQPVSDLAFLPEGRLVTASRDGTVQAAATATTPAQVWHRGQEPILALAEDGRGGVLWGQGTNVYRRDADGVRVLGRHERVVTALARMRDGEVASGSLDGQVLVWSRDGTRTTAGRHTGGIVTLSFAEGVLASADERGEIRIRRGKDVLVLRGHSGTVSRIDLRAHGRILSTGPQVETRLWLLAPPRRSVVIGSGDVFRLVWSPASDAVGAGARDGSVRWLRGLENTDQPLGTHAQFAYDVRLTLDGKTLVTGGWDGVIKLWPVDGGPPRVFEHGSPIWELALSPDGRALASIGEEGAVKLWDLQTGAARELHRHKAQGMNLTFSPDSTRIASSSADGEVRIHDRRDESLRILPSSEEASMALRFSPDGKLLYGVSYDGAVREWAGAAGAARILIQHTGAARTLALSPDGTMLASGGTDRTIRLLDLASGRTRTIYGHDDEVRHVTFSPDGRRLASAGVDGSVRWFDVRHHDVVVLRGHRGRVNRVAFSPDGAWLASAGQDGTVGLWPIASAAAVPAIGRDLGAWLASPTSALASLRAPLATPWNLGGRQETAPGGR